MTQKKLQDGEVFGFVKPKVDVHTLGIASVSGLLRDCGYQCRVAPDEVGEAIEDMQRINSYGILRRWITENRVSRLGFSYRLDPKEGCGYFMAVYDRLVADKMLVADGGCLRDVFFAGLPDTCRMVQGRTGGAVTVFPGDEAPAETLSMLGVPKNRMAFLTQQRNEYDDTRWKFAEGVIASEKYKSVGMRDHYGYGACGKAGDSFVGRYDYAKSRLSLPLIRAHVGPYNPDRLEGVREFIAWVKNLAASRLLDVLSIGTSQLTQSHFGEDWEGLPNGGGVPINSEVEYQMVREAASPMLVRTYSGTKDVLGLAKIHERSLNIAWHALSLWWFCEIDGRGSNTVLENLREHFEAMRYIASTGKPMEPNVPHHFAFRGADDVTYIISGYLAAKAAKLSGIRHLILQNMLNTPKQTSGVQDLAKGRAMLRLVRELEDSNFRIYLQSRAGLDYFSPDEAKAKSQLAAVTALMDDIEPDDMDSPGIIHVVSYSEAMRLATPEIVKESIQITLSALDEYREARKRGMVPDMGHDRELREREEALYMEAKESIKLLEKHIPDLYTPAGLYKVFLNGFLPVPFLACQREKYKNATIYNTVLRDGGVRVINDAGETWNTVDRYSKIIDKYCGKG